MDDSLTQFKLRNLYDKDSYVECYLLGDKDEIEKILPTYLSNNMNDMEGIVYHRIDGPAKIDYTR